MNAVAFEVTKVRTLRSLTWCLVACAVVSVAIALLFGWVIRGAYDDMSEAGRASFDPVASGFNGLRLGMIALVVFGVLLGAGEYAGGTIGSSLLAVPRRGELYAAKVAVGGSVAFVVSALVVAATFAAAQTAIGPAHNAAVTDPGVARAMAGAVLYMTLLATFAIGTGMALRSVPLSLGILVPLFFMVSEVLNNLPGVRSVAQFLPDAAGRHILRREPPDEGVLGHWSGIGVLALWAAAAVCAGWVSFTRRDS